MKTTNLTCPECNKSFVRNTKKLARESKNRKYPVTCSYKCAMACANKIRGCGPEKFRYTIKNDTDELNQRMKELYYLSQENSELFNYYFGLIASDGNLTKSNNLISFYSKDMELINIISIFYRNYFASNKFSIGTDFRNINPVYAIKFSNLYLKNLLKEIGITSAKSLTIGPINIDPRYFSHFLRGVIDGDGGWSINKKTRSIVFSLSSGSKEFLIYIVEELNKRGFLTTKITWRICGVYSLTLSVREYSDFIDFLYNDSHYYLTRKQERAYLAKEKYLKYKALS